MDSITWEEASQFSGWLEKQSPSLFKGWQKRFFRILKGKVLVYSEKENDSNPKGQISFDQISMASKVESKGFKFTFEGRDFQLKALSEKERDDWVAVINFLKDQGSKQQKKFEDAPVPVTPQIKSKGHKIQMADKDTLDLLKESGLGGKNDYELNQKCLKAKEVESVLNLKNPDIQSRIYFGFLFKRHKKMDMWQKRWFFLISSRPLTDEKYEVDDTSLDEKKLKKWLIFDTIFYFKYEGEDEHSEAAGNIPLAECHEVSILDKDKMFFLNLDLGDRKFEFYAEIKGDRDKWYEVVKNSRRTAKEVKQSFTKKPRNMCKLNNVLVNEGMDKFREECEEEKNKIIGNYKEIRDFDTLGFVLGNLEKQVMQTIDGCTVSTPPRIDVLKAYVDVFNTTYLLVIQYFWANAYTNINTPQIAELASYLFTYDEKLSNLGINDPNFIKNGKELIKIFMKKTYVNIRSLIENILKSEREYKAVRGSDGKLITNGPVDLFQLITSTFDLAKPYRVKFISEQMLCLIRECIIQYLIGVDCVTSNYKLDVDKEFLIAVANNSIKISGLLSDLIDEAKYMKVLNDKEIDDSLAENQILSSLNLMSTNCISRLVRDLSYGLLKAFEDHFLSLDIKKILGLTNEIYGQFNTYMNGMIQKKFWGEILKSTLYQFIKSLLTTAHKKVKTIGEITGKLKNDKEILFETYEKVLGENLTKETLKMIDDFLDFLEVSPDFISLSCQKLRDFNGPSFSLSTAKALINLRCDLSKEEKNEAIASCKEILDTFSTNPQQGAKAGGFFDQMENEIAQNIKLEEKEDKGLEDIIEVTAEKPARRGTINLSDFLKIESKAEDIEDEDDKADESLKRGSTFMKKTTEDTIDTDVVFSGVMKKKSSSVWQERFFQIKNGYLYWYKEEKSREAQNSIAIDKMKKVMAHKPLKFKILVGEKVYKFACSNDEEKEQWINALTSEMKKLKGEVQKKIENLYEMKPKKKVIVDFYKLNEIGSERAYMKSKVEEALRKESFFMTLEHKASLKSNKQTVEQKSNKESSVVYHTEEKSSDKSFSSGKFAPFDNIETPSTQRRSGSLFSCCSKILALFRRTKTGEYEEHLNV